MFDDVIRRWKARWFAPLVARLGFLSPTVLSLAAFALGLACAVAASQAWYLPALALWLLNRLLDGLDGEVARAHGRASDFGGYLDIMLDVAVYALVPAGLAFADPNVPCFGGLALLLGAYYLNAASWTYLSAILEKRRANAQRGFTTVNMPPGLIAGTETFVFYCAFMLLPQYLAVFFATMAALVLATVAQRLYWAWRNLLPR